MSPGRYLEIARRLYLLPAVQTSPRLNSGPGAKLSSASARRTVPSHVSSSVSSSAVSTTIGARREVFVHGVGFRRASRLGLVGVTVGCLSTLALSTSLYFLYDQDGPASSLLQPLLKPSPSFPDPRALQSSLLWTTQCQ